MLISEETIKQIKLINLSTFIGKYIQLKKRGQNYIGLCPFHGEKTPSFNVSSQKNFWYCFGCHESGDHISFLMKLEQLTFNEAVEEICNQNQITISKNNQTSYENPQNNYKEVLTIYKKKCAELIYNYPQIVSYLEKRRVSIETIKKFDIGFEDQYGIKSLITEKKIPINKLKSYGLVLENLSKARFLHRIMFPIKNYRGQTLGFGGRQTNKNQNGKYINSPENEFFNKRSLLYGLDLAKSAIRNKKRVIVVEGYMDVILAHQHGFNETVAIMGTAFTQNQCNLIRRFTDTCYLLLDKDKAGIQASEKSFEVLTENKINVFTININTKDLADFFLKSTNTDFENIIKNSESFIKDKYKKIAKIINNPELKSKEINNLIRLTNLIDDSVIKEDYFNEISLNLNISQIEITKRRHQENKNPNKNKNLNIKVKKISEKAEEYLIQCIIKNPNNFEYIKNENILDDLELKEYIYIISNIIRNNKKNVLDHIENTEIKRKLCKILLESHDDFEDISMAVKIIKKNIDKERRNKLINNLKKSEKKEDISKINEQFGLLISKEDK